MPFVFGPAQASDSPLLGSLLAVGENIPCVALHIPEGTRESAAIEHEVRASSAHLLIHAGARSDATVVLLFEGDGKASYDLEIIVEDEAALHVLCIQRCPATADVMIRQRSLLGNGSRLTAQNITVGGKTVDHDFVSRATGDDATSGIDWMFYGKGTERHTLSARNVFDGRNGGGEILMKGVAQDKAHVGCNGLIEIGLAGGGTNTYLTQDVLMLDASAKVDAIPGLEIKTNDVKASHSATVSRVTPEDLFYFGARGIPQDEAKRMYVLGFLGDITGRIPSESLRTRVSEAVEANDVA